MVRIKQAEGMRLNILKTTLRHFQLWKNLLFALVSKNSLSLVKGFWWVNGNSDDDVSLTSARGFAHMTLPI